MGRLLYYSREMAAGSRLAVVAFAVLLFATVLPPTGAAQESNAHQRQRVLVYYANETSQAAAESANYQALLATLSEARSEAGSMLAHWIESDSELFRKVVRRDEQDLFRAAREFGFDLAFFDNTKAQNGVFRFFDHRTGSDRYEPFGVLPPAENAILATSPLTRTVALRTALENVSGLYGDSSVDVVLIAFSHGSVDMAVMPRVSANLSTPDARAEFLRVLAEGPNPSGQSPAWAQIQGITKKEFWQVLEDVSRRKPVLFPLVFRQSCSSGISDFTEWRQLPDSVTRVAHTSVKNMHLAYVDYNKVFAGSGRGVDWQDKLETGLAHGPVKVEGRATLWFDPLMRTIASIHPAWFILPLVAWLGWLTAILFGSRRPSLMRG